MRLTIDEYSKQFKMSKEMINSKLKTKKLNYIIEDGITYIIISQTTTKRETQAPEQTPILRSKTKITVATVLSLYQKENTSLKNKILELELKIDKLIDDKEQMLRYERDKIEELYTKKDTQLRNILELINTKILMEKQTSQTVHEIEIQENDELVELKEHLKSLGIKSHERKIIKKRFLNTYDSDSRIIHKEGKLYLDLFQYDYGDLLQL
jgi:hypothetical protein